MVIMRLSAHMYSNKGGRNQNEDTTDYYINGDKGVFIVADGLGGHKNGAEASKLAVATIMPCLRESDITNGDEIKETILDANRAILDKQKEAGFADMRTTAVVLYIDSGKAFWGHIGDSRLYCFNDGTPGTVTRDHSVSYKKFLGGDISYREINTDDDRSSLLGVMGNKDRCAPEACPEPWPVKSGDAFLLCSDGFWEYVYDEEIHIDLLKSKTPKEWADFMLLRHIRKIKPQNDNYSLITVFVE